MTDELVRRVFEKIDKDRDGVISYKEYLQWTNELLAYREPCGMPCFLSEPKI
jgi:Ca2+-binding EF-hand superfamily protein